MSRAESIESAVDAVVPEAGVAAATALAASPAGSAKAAPVPNESTAVSAASTAAMPRAMRRVLLGALTTPARDGIIRLPFKNLTRSPTCSQPPRNLHVRRGWFIQHVGDRYMPFKIENDAKK
jgi:hypothetical protein